jgi:histidinol phosphatase-like enzyme
MKRTYRKWTRAENEQIAEMYKAGARFKDIAAAHNATIGQIASKIFYWGMTTPQKPRVEPWERDWRTPNPAHQTSQGRQLWREA